METDRNVSEYMQKRNLLAENVGRILASQILLVAVFFCAYLFLQTKSRDIDLYTARIVVKTVLVVLSLLIALSGIIVCIKYSNFSGSFPDSIGLRQSHDIIEYAFSIAKDALNYRISICLVMLTSGILLNLLFLTFGWSSEKLGLIGKIVFWICVAIAVLLFIPAYDRMVVYKSILDGSILQKKVSEVKVKKNKIEGMLFFSMMPVSVCIYFLWRYFGNNRSIAFIVFLIAAILFGAFYALIEYRPEHSEQS